MTLTDKTGTPVTITKESDQFTVEIAGNPVGLAAFADRNGQRVFYHTEVDEAFGGRGLATILVAEALRGTRTEGLRIVPVCPLVVAYVDKHREQYHDIVDEATPEILQWLSPGV